MPAFLLPDRLAHIPEAAVGFRKDMPENKVRDPYLSRADSVL